jgi:tetratricopeptide (TPR) repeat protein
MGVRKIRPVTGARRNSPAGISLLLLAAFLLSSAPARAERIHLKNGRTIVADVVGQDEKRLYLMRGGNEYSIPRAIVERIEETGTPVEDFGSSGLGTLNLPMPPPPRPEVNGPSLTVRNGAVDEAALQALDNEVVRNPGPETRRRLALGYQEAAIFLTEQGRSDNAIEMYRHALRLAPDDLSLTLALGYLLVKQDRHNEAIEALSPAGSRFPRSPDIPMLLGSAYYASENLDRAIEEWKKALAIQEEPRLREALGRAEQERDVAANFQELRSPRFLIRFEGREVRALGLQVLRALETAYVELTQSLDFIPRETIVVLLYPDQAFRDVARSPSWVGAVNDGKIRMPVSGLSTVTADVYRVLKHELTHSFVRQMTAGRCPTWFNEGLAQLEEGATTAGVGPQLARDVAAGNVPPLAALETSFLELPGDQVGAAYAKSLAAVEYLRATYGPGVVRRLLQAMPSNPDFGSLLREHFRLSYDELDRELAASLTRRYGR